MADAVYLQSASGSRVGPMPAQWLELLYHQGIVDRATPVSLDGDEWRRLGEWDSVEARLREVDRAVRAGQNPWPVVLDRSSVEPEPDDAPDSGAVNESLPPPIGSNDIPPAATTGSMDLPDPDTPHVIKATPLAAWLIWASGRATGEVTIRSEGSSIELSLRRGKVARVQADDASADLETMLIERQLISLETLNSARAQLERFDGDLGGVLVATGAIAPHALSALALERAITILSSAVTAPAQELELRDVDVPRPQLPLELDRMGPLMEVVRRLSKEQLEPRLEGLQQRTIQTQNMEGVSSDELRFKPRELRTVNACSGKHTVAEIVSELGTDEERKLSALQVIFFLVESGLATAGEDPRREEERTAAAKLRRDLERMEGWTLFEVLGVPKGIDDRGIRNRYNELIKKYHPDRLRRDAHPELREVQNEMFRLVNDAFTGLQTEQRRKAYLEGLNLGTVVNTDERRAKRSKLAEPLFKKAETLMQARRFDDALDEVVRALKLSPQDPRFVTHQIYLDYLIRSRRDQSDRLITTTIEAIKAASLEHKSLVCAHLFIARLYKALGDSRLMIRSFKRVLHIEPNHLEAQQELRLARLRREKEKTTKKRSWLGI